MQTEHDSMDATKKAKAVLNRDKKHSTKLIQKVNSMKQQLRSSEQRLLRLQGKIDGGNTTNARSVKRHHTYTQTVRHSRNRERNRAERDRKSEKHS